MGNSAFHHYQVSTVWTGNLGSGTRSYTSYSRDHELLVAGKPPLAGSADPAFMGDPARYNPEELLVAALSACHMLWFLHLAVGKRLPVQAYRDEARDTMVTTPGGGGFFSEVVLRPAVTVDSRTETRLVRALHERAHALCFVANSVNFPVKCEPVIRLAGAMLGPETERSI